MKKQKSSTVVLSEFPSSDDESEKATPKIDKKSRENILKIVMMKILLKIKLLPKDEKMSKD